MEMVLPWKSNNYAFIERASVAAVMLHVMRMRSRVIGDLSGSSVFFHLSKRRQDFLEKKY